MAFRLAARRSATLDELFPTDFFLKKSLRPPDALIHSPNQRDATPIPRCELPLGKSCARGPANWKVVAKVRGRVVPHLPCHRKRCSQSRPVAGRDWQLLVEGGQIVGHRQKFPGRCGEFPDRDPEFFRACRCVGNSDHRAERASQQCAPADEPGARHGQARFQRTAGETAAGIPGGHS
jgi:hypothetical protein